VKFHVSALLVKFDVAAMGLMRKAADYSRLRGFPPRVDFLDLTPSESKAQAEIRISRENRTRDVWKEKSAMTSIGVERRGTRGTVPQGQSKPSPHLEMWIASILFSATEVLV